MDREQIINDYKRLMKLYYPQLSKLSSSVNKTKFKPFVKKRFPQNKITSLSFNNYRLLTQPNEVWTKEQLLEAQKVVKYLSQGKVMRVPERTSYTYKKPLYWGRT